jgi:hypothetical protein
MVRIAMKKRTVPILSAKMMLAKSILAMLTSVSLGAGCFLLCV